MRIAVLLTTTPALAAPLLARLRARHPGSQFAAFVRDEDRTVLQPALAGCEVRRDKPAGGRLRFLRALRHERFDLLVVAWHGGDRWQPLRLAALFAGARRVRVVDERDREWTVRWYLPWTWGAHACRRAAAVKPVTVLRGAAAVYRATLGAVLAVLALPVFVLLHPRCWPWCCRLLLPGAGGSSRRR